MVSPTIVGAVLIMLHASFRIISDYGSANIIKIVHDLSELSLQANIDARFYGSQYIIPYSVVSV